MPAELAEMLRPRVERLGYLGEFFQGAANQPEVLVAFQRYTEALKRALPDKLTELVSLSVAAMMANKYEQIQPERLSLKRGFGQSGINEVISLRPRRAAVVSD